MEKKIMLVDDEKDIIEFLKYNLEAEGFTVIEAFDGQQAMENMKHKPDLVVLDIMMPKMDGYEVCRKIRSSNDFENTPVIFLTAKSSEVDEVLGLELGANDYVQKPVSPKKLIARIKSNLRNYDKLTAGSPDERNKISIGPLTIDRERYVVHIDGNETVFPRKEFELLYYLAGNPGIVFSRSTLLKDVWGSDVYVVDRTVDVHIRKIREKLDSYSELIETIKGVGYRFKNIS
jgi:two-component system alkaline phosphatase synthesis response regulator PhoP